MYITMFEVDPRYTVASMALSNAGYMHRKIMNVFGTARRDHKVLYRLVRDPGKNILYVQSDIVPDWRPLAGCGFKLIDVKNIDSLKNVFKNEKSFNFSIMAYPSKKIDDTRTALKDTGSRMAWLAREAEKNGFEVLSVCETRREKNMFEKNRITYNLFGSLFDGVLKIKDEDRFWNGFVSGIGPEKAYGYGLLMLSLA